MLWTRGILLCETNPTLRRGQMHLSIRCAANGLPNPGVGQSGRPLRLGRRCRRFKSFHPDHIGELAERSKALVLKTRVRQRTVGSNPTLSANIGK